MIVANIETVETITQIDTETPHVLILRPVDLKEDESWNDSFYDDEAKQIVSFLARYFCRNTMRKIRDQITALSYDY